MTKVMGYSSKLPIDITCPVFYNKTDESKEADKMTTVDDELINRSAVLSAV